MIKIIDRVDSRGHFNHGWLNTYHTFSFGDYYNLERIRFGTLRVINDDTIKPSEGFPLHPHNDMEIVSIPLKGYIRHGDSMNNSEVITKGEIQVMSAGRGIKHLEYNDSKTEDLSFLQIWIFPKTKATEPRYNNYVIKDLVKQNDISLILSPTSEAYLNQDAWISLANMDKSVNKAYNLYGKNTGVYIMVLEGKLEIEGEILERRNGIGITDVSSFDVKALENSEAVFFEVAM